jgi:predicted permease
MLTTFRRLFARFVALSRTGRADAELTRELGAHLALLEDEFRRRGMTDEEARRQARLALGGIEQTKERQRNERSLLWLEDAWRDAAYALRLLRRSRSTSAIAIASLAIGIGANTAVFTVANALLFRAPAGVTAPGRLVDIGVSRDDAGFNPASFPAYLDVRSRTTTLDGVYAHPMFPEAVGLSAGGAERVERTSAHFVTLNYFSVLGVRPFAGRLFGAADDPQPGASALAVLSHRFWRRRFNADPSIVGQAIRLNGNPYTVVGVAPEGFQGTSVVACDLWLPLSMITVARSQDNAVFSERRSGWLNISGRLKPGVSIEQASAEIATIGLGIDDADSREARPRGLRLVPSSVVPGNRSVIAILMLVLMALVSLVLLTACANVSGILLARTAARRREIAVRLSIGAARWRLVRQLLMETAVLFLLGGAAGLLLADIMRALLVRGLPSLPFPISVSLALDVRVFAFTTGLSLVAALLFGVMPALQVSKANPVTALKEDEQGPPARSRLRQAFVVLQVAASVALIVVAGLFVRALGRSATDAGFDPRGIEIAVIDIGGAGYNSATGPLFWRDLVDRIRQQPGIQHATLAWTVPGGFESLRLGLAVPDAAPTANEDFVIDANIVERGYFATLRIPIVEGRDFTDADDSVAQPVVIVGQSAARHFWPGQQATGKYLSQPGPNGTKRLLRVVGVAGDIRSSTLIDGLSNAFVYVPLRQQPYMPIMTTRMNIVTRMTEGRSATESIRSIVASMNSRLFVTPQSIDDVVALGLVPQRVAAAVAGTLGSISVLLAAIGIYGMMLFSVARRAREFGIRIALGATRGNVMRLVLSYGLRVTTAGCAIGLLLGAGMGQVLGAFLLGLPPLDPVTFGVATILVVLIGLTACYGPVRRATSTDPLIALRAE